MSNDRQKIEEDSFLQTEEQKDQMADHMSDALTASDVASREQAVDEPTQEPALTALEEERVRDEVEIQIDLLKDPDWAVRREAAITLGEMGDERCVEPLVRALQDGDWQVREVASEALGMVGSPAVDPLIKLCRSWDHRKAAIRA
jgi:FOG: HEAT repeat